MSKHLSHRMHENSTAAYSEELPRISKRAIRILGFLMIMGNEYTDRQVQRLLGFENRSDVQPRISELKEAGLVVETGKTKCDVTGKTVRLVRYANARKEEANGQGLLV